MIAQIGATGFHFVWCHVFVTHLEMGLTGIGVASTLSSSLLLCCTLMYASSLSEIEDAIFWPDVTVWHGWKEYISLMISTTTVICA